MRNIAIGITLLLLAQWGLVQRCMAQETVELRTHIDQDRQTVFRSVEVNAAKIETRMDGQIIDKKDSTEQEVLQGTQTVVTVENGTPTAAKFTFDDACGLETTEPGQNATQEKYAFGGKTVTLRQLPGGGASDDFTSDLPAEQRETLRSLFTPDSDDFPDHPISIGDSWDTSAANRRHLNLAAGDALTSFCRLDWIKNIGGRRTAQLTFSAAIIRHFEGFIRQEQQCDGTELVDLATGTIVRVDMKGPVTYAGKQQTPGPEGHARTVEVSGSGSTTLTAYNAPAGWASTRPSEAQ